MAINTSDIKKLREKTGAGMMDCKKALVEADGDFQKAEKNLKELGLAAAQKRSGRATNEGRIFSLIKENKGGLLELACETDFVARNKDFIAMGEQLLTTAIDNNLNKESDDLQTIIKEGIAKIKENIMLRRLDVISAGESEMMVDYIHGNGSIGVIVKLSAENSDLLKNNDVKQFAFDCALHIAAYNPQYLSRDTVDQKYLDENRAIFEKQMENSGKPENIIDKIVEGKINKHLSEVCFLDQGFVKDDKKKVSDVAKEISKAVGGKIDITDYLYYKVGEEIEE